MLRNSVIVAKRLLHSSLAIRHSPLPRDLKRQVQTAARRLDRANLRGKRQFKLFGSDVHFAGETSFRHVFGEVFSRGCYYFEADTDAPLIFDCGSNIGMSVLFFKKLYPKARVVAFEPDPATFAVLTENTASLPNITIHQLALGNQESSVDFYRDHDASSSSLTMSTKRERHNGPSITVPMVRLSTLINEPIDLLKLDVEGAERDVLTDIQPKLGMVKAMHIEYHHHVGQEPALLSSFLKILEDSGFDYQVSAEAGTFAKMGSFQDVSLYCYRREVFRNCFY